MKGDYAVRKWVCTGDMGTYKSETVYDLTREDAIRLYRSIKVDGKVTQVDLLHYDTIRLKDDECEVNFEEGSR